MCLTRCAKLNKAVGGAKNRLHTTGEAVDIRSVSDKVSDNKALFDLILKLGLPFDQLLDEYGYDWIHISYRQGGNRKQILHVKNNHKNGKVSV